jgi:hypothetical protein
MKMKYIIIFQPMKPRLGFVGFSLSGTNNL